MSSRKAGPRGRCERQRKPREIRRGLAAITPENSHPQAQAWLYSVLPAELRLQIFKLILSQQSDLTRELDDHAYYPHYRLGHTHRTTVDIALTCRLVYCEAHTIPLRSATHHSQALWEDNWLHRITKQRGADLYHLHDSFVSIFLENFSDYLLLGWHWRRITWTISEPGKEAERAALPSILSGLTLPASCEEVNLELERMEDFLHTWPGLLEVVRACRKVTLARRNNTRLEFDENFAPHYKWVGSAYDQWDDCEEEEKRVTTYHTFRLCWRARIPRREYMSYDHLDCLSLDDRPEVLKVLPLTEVVPR